MKRLFKEHEIRKVIDLGGAWRILTDEGKDGIEQGWYRGLPGGDTVIVPSVFNNELGLLNYEGYAWYERKFKAGGTLLFEFESVMTAATVWLDGEMLGEHYGAFTKFDFTVADVQYGEHTLVVLADSTLDKKSFPQINTDWFNYGGIARDVSIHELLGISVMDNHIVYELSDDLDSAAVSADLVLYNAAGEKLSSGLSVKVGDNVIYEGEVTLDAHERISFKTPCVALESIKLWDTDAPNLYIVVVETDTDDLIDRVGFRKIEIKNREILLNGKPIELLGVNRHEEHPEWGFAFPPKLMKRDLDLITDLGCNTLRGSHYPNSKIFVDMLDERGILFWSEIPMWGVGFSEEALNDADVVARGLQMHREMTEQYYNHPSIIIWGMHNEIRTSLYCTYDITNQYYEHLRAYGGNRLITHASNHPFDDCCMVFDDFISINIYYGWYGHGGKPGDFSEWDKFVCRLDERLRSEGLDSKPVIMSEFGAAALAGFHSHFDTVRWSEEYQRDLLEYCIELFHKTDYMQGMYVWQFSNVRTSPTMDINRARYFNNKGILDEYRNTKAAYFKIKELYRRYREEKK